MGAAKRVPDYRKWLDADGFLYLQLLWILGTLRVAEEQ
jgi:hypothetical protein